MSDERSEERKLTPANENPWYLMMTLLGEPEGLNDDRVKGNQLLWNKWIAHNLGELEKSRFLQERRSLTTDLCTEDDFESQIRTLFLERQSASDRSLEIPKRSSLIDLSETEFSVAVYFNKFIFADVSFAGSEFKKNAQFDYADFQSNPIFIGSVFRSKALFRWASFRKDSDWGFTRFEGPAEWVSSKFCGSADFRNCSFDHAVTFFGCHFGTKAELRKSRTSFFGSTFSGPTSFEDAVFLSDLPTFEDAVLHEVTTVTAKGSNWPKLPSYLSLMVDGFWGRRHRDSETKGFHDRRKASAAKLRHAMAKQALPEEEHFFFRCEMHHAARAEPFLRTGHIYLFGAVSDYGYSIIRPANCLLAVWLLGAMIFAEATSFGLVKSLGYSFANMFKFFGLHRTYFDFEVIRDWPAWVQTVSGMQTVLAFILLFFLGLGLRTRFRLR